MSAWSALKGTRPLQIALVLEYMDGGSLGDVLEKARARPPPVSFASQPPYVCIRSTLGNIGMLSRSARAEEERARGHPVRRDWAGAAGAVVLASLQAHGMPSCALLDIKLQSTLLTGCIKACSACRSTVT